MIGAWQLFPAISQSWAAYEDALGTIVKPLIVSEPPPGIREKLGVASGVGSGVPARTTVVEFAYAVPSPIAVRRMV